MKLFQQLLVAPAALGLLAPVAANAAELNINGVSDYATSSEQVTSITQFSDVYPTDWAYQALSNLIERYGCVAGYPNGTYQGQRAMTRFEAAALLNACLDRVTEVTDELKRLMKEFERELAILKGRVDGLEARVGELEATQFSTTTKLKGLTTFITGAVNAGGDNGSKVLPNGETRDARSFSGAGTKGGADAYNANYGAWTFNYDQRFAFDTSFTGKDKLYARLRVGNFTKGENAFGGSGVNLTALDIATDSGASGTINNAVQLDRLFYKFPVGKEFTIIAGAIARNTEMLGMWPSVYNKGGAKILDWTALAGTSGVYNKQTGQAVGAYWKQNVKKGNNAFSVTVNYVAKDGSGNSSDPNEGGMFTDNSNASFLAQIGYGGPEWGLAFAYRYGQCGDNGFRRGTEFAKANSWNNSCGGKTDDGYWTSRTGNSSNSYALNAYWQPKNAGFIPSISVGWGLNNIANTGDNFYGPNNNILEPGSIKGGSMTTSQSWMVGLKWDDVFLKGNDLGFAFGQPTFATAVKGCFNKNDVKAASGNVRQNSGQCSETPFDGNYAFELYYNFQVTDNIAITPAIFYLSRPMGQNTSNLVQNGQGYDGTFNIFGGLIQTTFKF
jgi:hypothetical protein